MIIPNNRFITLSTGVIIETPLLIPSFSSKGFSMGISNDGQNIISEVGHLIDFSINHLYESALVSAYDIHHGFVQDVDNLASSLEVLVIDSGGYESKRLDDFSDFSRKSELYLKWNERMHLEQISKLSSFNNLILVSFDSEGPNGTLEEQMAKASIFFNENNFAGTTILIKPEGTNKYIDVETIIDQCEGLEQFDIIGLTEKELGSSLVERLERIETLVSGLRSKGIDRPIHLFGNLDPFTTVLFFLKGVEIFDGLVWLKLAFWDGLSVYKSSFSIFNRKFGDLDATSSTEFCITNNIEVLSDLKTRMKEYYLTKDISVFKFERNDFFLNAIKRFI